MNNSLNHLTSGLIIFIMILVSVFATTAEVNAEQSSFEYKKYHEHSQYRQALKERMKDVSKNLSSDMEDEKTYPIPGLIETCYVNENSSGTSKEYIPQGLCSTGDYWLITAYDSKKKNRSVIYDDDDEVQNTEGISYLEEEDTYFIWVSASELTSKQADVTVSCSRIEFIETDSPGSFSIKGPTIIGFKANETANYAVYSLSESNINGSVYDSKGFPLNKDNNSGGSLSENKNDFALILQAEKGKGYLIFADGDFKDCVINIAVYKGDGSSLVPEDLEIQKKRE